MAKLKGQVLVDRLIDALGVAKGAAGDGSAGRVLALNALNTAIGKVAQLGSLQFLQVWATITQSSGNDFAPLPSVAPLVDTGKKAVLGLPSGRRGILEYLGPDRILTRTMDDFGAWNTDRPSSWTWGADSAGVARVQFDRTNTSGGNLVYPFRYEMVPPAIADDNATTTVLPDGNYDETIVLPLAELEEKRKLGYSAWAQLYKILYGDDESNDVGRLALFFEQFRLKDDAEPDTEQLRKQKVTSLSEGS